MEKTMKKLSIITVNYNDLQGLEKTIYSITEQNYQNFELIVIDGGSTDGSKEFIENCSRIDYWVSEKDSGIYNAMNKGILAANGEYVIFMNGGDYFYSCYTLDAIKREFDYNIDILYGNAIFVQKDKKFQVDFPDKLNFSFFYSNSLCHQSIFYKRSLFDNYLFNENLRIVSDWEFNIKNICLFNKTYKHIHSVICYYDLNGISNNLKKIDSIERKTILKKFFFAFYNDYKMSINQLTESTNKPEIKDLSCLAINDEPNVVSKRRLNQFIYISQNNKISFKIIKGVMNLSLLFTPKNKINIKPY